MHVHRDPKVYLVGRPSIDPSGLAKFLSSIDVQWESDSLVPAEVLCETAGRTCYMSFAKPRPGGNMAYLQHILESGHGSCIEHGNWCFVFAGISRSCSHELVRHRAGWAYSMLSQRFVDESDTECVEPDLVANDPELHAIWEESVKASHNAYVKLVEGLTAKLKETTDLTGTELRKAARQTARSVLPNATETKIFVTANARAIRHFVEQRASRHAEVEIRKLAVEVLLIMRQEAPALFGDYTLEKLPDGTFEASTPYRKV